MTKTNPQAIESFNAALAFERDGRLAEALAGYERAVELQPDYVRALHNLGTLLDGTGARDAAEARFRAAIAADGAAAEPWAGLGANLRAAGRVDEARAAFEKALDLKPEFPAVRWNLALVDLAEGRFAEGWMNYLFRPSVDRATAPLAEMPPDLTGIVIDIADEQGLGDALFFVRFFPMLRARGAIVRYDPDPRLAGIFRRMLDFGEPGPTAPTVRVALGDLPYLLNIDTFLPPLTVSPLAARREAAAAALRAAGPPPYIGVTWRAGQRVDGWLFKEAPVDELGAVLRDIPWTLIDIQRAPGADEHARLERAAGRSIADLSAVNDDLETMLALMSLLDRYIGVSNTNMHLRAAAGRSAHVLVANPAEYRWMATGTTSPWFPGFSLYRQMPDGSWDQAFARLAEDLRR